MFWLRCLLSPVFLLTKRLPVRNPACMYRSRGRSRGRRPSFRRGRRPMARGRRSFSRGRRRRGKPIRSYSVSRGGIRL